MRVKKSRKCWVYTAAASSLAGAAVLLFPRYQKWQKPIVGYRVTVTRINEMVQIMSMIKAQILYRFPEAQEIVEESSAVSFLLPIKFYNHFQSVMKENAWHYTIEPVK
jgi:LytS/YehU family sensor histidine kinase